MVKHIHRPLGKIDIRRRIQVLEHILGKLLIVLNSDALVRQYQDLIEHHLAGAPHGIHYFLALPGIFL